jgi:hypothetical protein
VAGRFKLFVDEHWSNAHVKAARDAGWFVSRVVDVFGQGRVDPVLLAYCAEHDFIWVTSDERAREHVATWLDEGKTLPGVIICPQRHRVGPGRFVSFLDKLAAEDAPFAGTVRFLNPEGG